MTRSRGRPTPRPVKNTGVAQLVKHTDGAIGYVDLVRRQGHGLTFAAIKNKDGKFVQPTLDGATAALAGAEVKDDLTFNPLNAAGADATRSPRRPICWSTRPDDTTKASRVKGFAQYC